jgi:hypothetical protein
VEDTVLEVMRRRQANTDEHFNELCGRLSEYDECLLREMAVHCSPDAIYFPPKLNAKSSL